MGNSIFVHMCIVQLSDDISFPTKKLVLGLIACTPTTMRRLQVWKLAMVHGLPGYFCSHAIWMLLPTILHYPTGLRRMQIAGAALLRPTMDHSTIGIVHLTLATAVCIILHLKWLPTTLCGRKSLACVVHRTWGIICALSTRGSSRI